MIKNWKKISIAISICLILTVFFFGGCGSPEKIKKNIPYAVKTEQSETLVTEEAVPKSPVVEEVEKTPPQLNQEPKIQDEAPAEEVSAKEEPDVTDAEPIEFFHDEEPPLVEATPMDDIPEPMTKGPIVEESTCTISVNCASVLQNMDKLKGGKEKIIPANGVILSEQKIEFEEGESVFEVLKRTLEAGNIHLEFVKTPWVDSVYIKGIGNLYEFDCGGYSGWMYKVNGVNPTCGCSEYKLKKGDIVEFVFSCNYMNDSE